MKNYLVETIVSYRMRYVVKAKEEGDALDEVAFREEDPNFNEFSQKYLGSTILGTRELADNEVIELCDIHNAYAKSWPLEMKMEVFTNIIEYDEN
jgi:hypothetical protein